MYVDPEVGKGPNKNNRKIQGLHHATSKFRKVVVEYEVGLFGVFSFIKVFEPGVQDWVLHAEGPDPIEASVFEDAREAWYRRW